MKMLWSFQKAIRSGLRMFPLVNLPLERGDPLRGRVSLMHSCMVFVSILYN